MQNQAIPKDWFWLQQQAPYFLLHIPSLTVIQIKKADPLDAYQLSEKLTDLGRKLYPKNISAASDFSPKIATIALNVAEICNLSCSYCFAGDGSYGHSSLMTFPIAKRVIDALEPRHIKFFGGEPLLNYRLIKQVVSYCHAIALDCSFSMTTNGLLMTERKREYFYENNFTLRISYDGELSTKQRGIPQKKLELLQQKLRSWQSNKSFVENTLIRATFSPGEVRKFSYIIENMLNSFEYRLAFAWAATKTNRLTLQDVLTFERLLLAVVEHKIHCGKVEELLRLVNIRHHVSALHHQKIKKSYCNAGLSYISVSTRGQYFLCHRFTEQGHAGVGDIDSGLDRKKLFAIHRQRSMQAEPCRSCWMKTLCGGGCLHEHFMANNQLDKVDPIFCALQQAEILAAAKVYLHLYQEDHQRLGKL